MDKNILIIVDIQNDFIQTAETHTVYKKNKRTVKSKNL